MGVVHFSVGKQVLYSKPFHIIVVFSCGGWKKEDSWMSEDSEAETRTLYQCWAFWKIIMHDGFIHNDLINTWWSFFIHYYPTFSLVILFLVLIISWFHVRISMIKNGNIRRSGAPWLNCFFYVFFCMFVIDQRAYVSLCHYTVPMKI